MLIIVVSVFGHGDIFSRNALADYERLGKEIDRLIYDIVTRRQDVSTNAYYFSMEELDNDIKSITSVLNGMSRNFRSLLSIDYQFTEFAESMREFELPAHTDITPIRNFIEAFDSFELPDFDQIYEFVKAIVYYDINCLDGMEFATINSEQDTILYDYAYSLNIVCSYFYYALFLCLSDYIFDIKTKAWNNSKPFVYYFNIDFISLNILVELYIILWIIFNLFNKFFNFI